MDIKEAYKVMQRHCGIEVGDTVRVLRVARDYEMGWGTVWPSTINKYVGNEFEVVDIHNDLGFCMDAGCSVPFFVLELIEKKKNKLPDHIQTVIDKGDFGCHKEAVENLVAELIKNKEGE